MAVGFRAPRAGELRRWVELQDKDQTASAGDSLDEVFTTLATVPARVRAIFGGRVVDNVHDAEVATHTVIIRHRSDTAAWRWIRFDGRRFKVVSVMDPDERGIWLEILAQEERSGV